MIDQIVAAADAAQNSRQFAEAERLIKQALEKDPSHGPANVVLGLILAKTGRSSDAISRFNSVLEKDPQCFEAVFWLSVLYRMAGSFQDAILYAEQAVRLRPIEAHVQSNLGLCLLAVHDLDRAIAAFEKSEVANPNVPPNLHHLGLAYQLQGRDDEAIRAFKRTLALAPNSVDTLFALGQTQMNLLETEGAIDCAKRILVLNPRSAAAELMWASALIAEGRNPEAEAHIDAAVKLDPNDANGQAMLGMRYQALGRLEEANACFKKSIAAKPEQGFAYCAYVRNHKIADSEQSIVSEMEALTQRSAVPARGLSYLHFGLGKALEDLKQYEQAMQHFDEANRLAYRLRFGNQTFSKVQYASVFDWTIETFTQSFIERHRSGGLQDATPIFIVGMMRSGTTLVEQILSSHPEVNARGEQPFWMRRRQEAMPVGEPTLDMDRLKTLGEEYLRLMHSLGPDAPHLTDKMPDNFIVLGLLNIVFPNARIIHTMRHPIDTCISIYTTPNRTAVEYANDRKNIVFAYRQYQKLMEHWRRVLPADRFFEVQYENLIANREAITREMVAFCGLPWDDSCMHPEENRRSVATPSVWQVRQPVYTTSVERWRRYEPWLGPFDRLLDPK